MADQLRLRVVLDMAERVLAPMKRIGGASGETARALKAARDRLKELNDQQGAVANVQKQAAELARRLGFRFLDSGALYRLVGLAARQQGMAPDATNEAALASLARQLPVRFEAQTVWLADQDVTDAIRTEAAGMDASRVSALPAVRQALLALQRDFARLPGLVADGRDMGTVVFPDARLKVFLTADAAQRAERRYKQLISKGISANIDSLRADLEARDARDRDRAAAPLKAAPDALLLDNSLLSIAQSVEQVLSWWQARQPF